MSFGAASFGTKPFGFPQASSSSNVTGTLAATLDGVSMVATGGEFFLATMAATLDSVSMVATGGEFFIGTLDVTLPGVTMTSTPPAPPAGASSEYVINARHKSNR